MLTQERLKELINYDPETGVFTWLPRDGWWARTNRPAGCIKKGDVDYRVIRVDDILYRANRLAWLYMTGAWPNLQVDHKDRNGQNDAWLNLRLVTNKQNGENLSLRHDNKSGYRGVMFRKDTKRWSAKIRHNWKVIHLGCFNEKHEAVAARKAAEQKYYTHHYES